MLQTSTRNLFVSFFAKSPIIVVAFNSQQKLTITTTTTTEKCEQDRATRSENQIDYDRTSRYHTHNVERRERV